jgi:prepilin-type N-terminal cleavage/methylation domain-containing protein
MQYNKGFTLLEVLSVLLIIVILSIVAVQQYQKFIVKHRAQSYLMQLATAINNAKTQAYYRQTAVTICVLDAQQRCKKSLDWSSGITVFFDPLQQGLLNNIKSKITSLKTLPKSDSLTWNVGKTKHISIKANGELFHQNGSFLYQNALLPKPLKLVISQGGRVSIQDN